MLVKLLNLVFRWLTVLLYGGELGEPKAVRVFRLLTILAVILGIALVFFIF